MPTQDDMLREILSEQKVQNEKIDVISANQVAIAVDVRETRDSMIRVDEWRKGHMDAHSWIVKGLYAVALAVVLGIITGALKVFNVL